MSTKKLIAMCIVILTTIIGMIAFKVYSNYENDRQAEISYQQQKLEESKSDKQSSIEASQSEDKAAQSAASYYQSMGEQAIRAGDKTIEEERSIESSQSASISSEESAAQAKVDADINAINP